MNLIAKISAFVIIAFLAYYLTILATPYSILLFLKLKNGSTFNEPTYAEVVTDKERRVVLPNPDFLYVASGYNLQKGPVKISGKMPEDSYYSVALYAMNTRNFYVKNDRETPQKEFEFILATPEQKEALQAQDIEIVEAASHAGAILVRILITDPSQVPYLKEIQKSFTIEEVIISQLEN